jgi:HlyD family secretion protein
MTNYRVWGGVLLVAVLLGIALWPSAALVEMARAERGALVVTVDEEGETRVRERFRIAAPLTGRLLRIVLEPGDAVVKGETVLARFVPGDPRPLDVRSRAEAEAAVRAARASLGGARAEHRRSEADLVFAKAQLERSRRLAAEGIVAVEELEQLQSTAQALEEAFRASQFAASSAEYELERTRAVLVEAGVKDRAAPAALEIVSPIDGVVLKRLRWSEAAVQEGEVLLELGDPEDLEIVSDMLSVDAVQIRPGARVRIEQWGGEHALNGRVRRVEPAGFTKISALGVEEQRVNVIAALDDPVSAWKRLGDGYRVEVRVVVWEGGDVLKVPTSCLFRYEGGWAVFAVESGKARLRGLELGRRNGVEAHVVSGLEEGAEVIVHPSDNLADGTPVRPRLL